MPFYDMELHCPHCGADHLYRVPANDLAPWDDFCEECEGRYTVDPETESTRALASL